MLKRPSVAILAGITIFLFAFGAALAVSYVQGTKTLPGTLDLQSTVVVSGDTLFKLWQDAEMTRPVTDIRWEAVKTQAVGGVREFLRVKTPPIFIHNITTDTLLRPIAPCFKFQLDGTRPAIAASFETLPGPDGKNHDRGNACLEDWPEDWWLNPGEKWIMHPGIQFDQAPKPGKYDFPLGGRRPGQKGGGIQGGRPQGRLDRRARR